MKLPTSLFRIALVVSAFVWLTLPVKSQDIEHGKALVEINCARCHGVGTDDVSSHSEAPEFRILGQRYPVDALEEAFAEGIVTGHPDMPEFQATPRQIEDIIAYMASIQE